MPQQTWFLFDIGNVLIRLAYERVLANICRQAATTRDELVEILEDAGGYRDMERGAVSFYDFYEFLCDRASFRGSIRDFHALWSDFFDGPVPGMEDLLDRVREQYRVAFLSNSNEVHAELIPRTFGTLFRKDDRFVFSHRFKTAKPDPVMYHRALEVIGAVPSQVVYVDDLIENVIAAQGVGMRAYQFIDALSLARQLEADGLLAKRA